MITEGTEIRYLLCVLVTTVNSFSKSKESKKFLVPEEALKQISNNCL